MKKYLPENNTIKSLFYIATLVIVVNFIFWNNNSTGTAEKDFEISINSGILSEIIEREAISEWENDFWKAECNQTFASTQITKINQSSYNFGKTLTSVFFHEPIYYIFTSINAP